MRVDLTHEIDRKPRRDPLERALGGERFQSWPIGWATGKRVDCRLGLNSRSPHLASSPNFGVPWLQEGARDVPTIGKGVAD
jgi:hypothetical protein